MRRLRVPATALICALLALLPGVALAQGGAGDNQYQDPFGGSGAKQSGGSASGGGSSSGSSGSSGSTGPSSQPPLTSRPTTNLGSPGNGATTTTAPAAASPRNPSATGQLPNTGLDVPGIAALGLGLLVAGIGLRLRTADARLF